MRRGRRAAAARPGRAARPGLVGPVPGPGLARPRRSRGDLVVPAGAAVRRLRDAPVPGADRPAGSVLLARLPGARLAVHPHVTSAMAPSHVTLRSASPWLGLAPIPGGGGP